VGYTNAGKSTLFNRLTEANAFVADQVFATLDPTMRRIDIEGFGEAIISDTVGFIRDLPHGLVSAFHATLEEVSHADLLIHVVDATDPDRGEMMAAVNQVLDEIDANQIPTIMVYNKIDLGERDSDIEQGREGRIPKVWLSAVSGEGIPLLLQGIADHLGSDRRQFRLRLPVSASRLRASLYRRGSVVTEAFTDEGDSLLELNLDSGDIGWLEQQEELNSGSTLESIAATTQG
jgi:GTP-binding protein HflX